MKPNTEIKDRFHITEDKKQSLLPKTTKKKKKTRDTDVQNSLLDSVGEGEGGTIWENGIETCII